MAPGGRSWVAIYAGKRINCLLPPASRASDSPIGDDARAGMECHPEPPAVLSGARELEASTRFRTRAPHGDALLVDGRSKSVPLPLGSGPFGLVVNSQMV